MQDLGTLPGGTQSSAYGINDSGQVVGWSNSSSSSTLGQAFLYSGRQMIDLNTLIPADSGWTLRQAQAINSTGQIVAYGDKEGVGRRALLLTPSSATPEEQLQALKEDLNALDLPHGANTSLQAKLNDALSALQDNDTASACTALSDFINQLNAQAGKKNISQSEADSLTAAARQIMTAIGCQ